MGCHVADIARSSSGAPIWPVRLVGSIAHDTAVAAAVVARSDLFGGIGVDVEVAEPLESDLVALIANPVERRLFHNDPFGKKALFSIKEAVFKAVNPRDRIFLDF